MYSITKGDITIREMKESDIMPLFRAAGTPYNRAYPIIKELKKQICEKNEMSDLLFVILYQGKQVGKIDVEYTDCYNRNPKYKGIKTNGFLHIEIPPYNICKTIADDVGEMFIELCKQEAFVDVLGIPKAGFDNVITWEPMTILPASM